MYNLKAITEAGIGSKKDGDYYYPDNMEEASAYFTRGYYQNSILVQVTDGTLKVGIRKTSTTGKSNNAWTCFDNFQIHYLGTINPDDFCSANMKVKSGKYGTFVAPFDVTMPEGVSAYSANVEGNIVNLTEIVGAGDILPAGKPVVIKNDSNKDVNIDFPGTKTDKEKVQDGVLVGFYKSGLEILANGSTYVLQTQDERQAFYKVTSTFTGTANRCYLTTNTPTGANILRFDFDDEETAITEIEDGEVKIETSVFDLSGRKVNPASAKKGIYIINGKKVLK